MIEMRKRGARLHPMSGAGRIKDDGSDDSTVYEVKDANRSLTLNAKALRVTFMRAAHEGKDAMWIVKFANGMVAEIHLGMERTTHG